MLYSVVFKDPLLRSKLIVSAGLALLVAGFDASSLASESNAQSQAPAALRTSGKPVANDAEETPVTQIELGVQRSAVTQSSFRSYDQIGDGSKNAPCSDSSRSCAEILGAHHPDPSVGRSSPRRLSGGALAGL